MSGVHVAVAGRPYDVLIGQGLIERAGELIAPLLKRRRVAIVMDETVERLHSAGAVDLAGRRAAIAADPVVIAPGEGAKSFAELEMLSDALLSLELERGDLIVGLWRRRRR